MKVTAAVVNGEKRDFELEEIELDAPKDNEVLIKLVATGVCHTDVAGQDGLTTPMPVVLGHEGTGIVEQVGAAVSSVQPGDKVILSFSYCGKCRNCLEGHPGMCEKFNDLNFAGPNFDGTHRMHKDRHDLSLFFGQSSFATYTVVDEHNIVKVPDDADVDLAYLGPLGCGLQTGSGSVLNYLKPEPGATIDIFGMGPVGLSAVMGAKIAEASRILVFDLNDQRLTMAKELGATDVFNSKDIDVEATVKELIPGGIDYSLDTTGNGFVIKNAIHILRPAGTCVLIGIGGDNQINVMNDLLAESKKLVGVVEGDSIPQEYIPKLIKYYQDGKFPLDKLIKVYDFQDINQAFADFKAGKVFKPIVKM